MDRAGTGAVQRHAPRNAELGKGISPLPSVSGYWVERVAPSRVSGVRGIRDCLSEQPHDRLARGERRAGEAGVPAEVGLLHTQGVEDGGVEILRGHRIAHRGRSCLVGLAVDGAAANPAAGGNRGEALGPMDAAGKRRKCQTHSSMSRRTKRRRFLRSLEGTKRALQTRNAKEGCSARSPFCVPFSAFDQPASRPLTFRQPRQQPIDF